ncbi:MAG: recombinase family protein [Lewinellaceae bacterium]|nr:recombinase family protein [Lewinellaceae bacterium]
MEKRAAIYARVSTLDKGQDPENQLIQLRDYARRRGFHLVGEFVDYAPGASEQREEYQKMVNQVRKRKVDVVLVWRYDRFARSTQALARACWEVVLW